MSKEPAAWLAVAADGSESSAVYMLKEQADAAAREWGWFVVPLYALPSRRAEDEIAIEAAWGRTGLNPTWADDEPGCGVKYANAMADEILRLRITEEEREAVEGVILILRRLKEYPCRPLKTREDDINALFGLLERLK